jgi:hypothetical protein
MSLQGYSYNHKGKPIYLLVQLKHTIQSGIIKGYVWKILNISYTKLEFKIKYPSITLHTQHCMKINKNMINDYYI